MIDILLPYYGSPDHLRQAVCSVLAQTSPEWRLTVVDDAFPDPKASAWVADVPDERVRHLRNSKNLGVSANFKRCLEFATADRVVFLGCDDVMRADYVALVQRTHEALPDATMIQPRVNVIDEAGSDVRTLTDAIKTQLAPRSDGPMHLGGEALAKSLMWGNWLYFPAIAWKREVIADFSFRDDMQTAMDLDLLMRLVMTNHGLVLLDEVAYDYRRHSSSVSSRTAVDTERFDEEGRLYAEMVVQLERQGWQRAARAARLHPTSRLHALSLLPAAIRRGQQATARRLILHALT